MADKYIVMVVFMVCITVMFCVGCICDMKKAKEKPKNGDIYHKAEGYQPTGRSVMQDR